MGKKAMSSKSRRLKAGIKITWLFLILIIFTTEPVSVSAYQADKLIPMGSAIGINMSFDGAAVVNVVSTSGGVSPAENAGIKAGDIIIEINGVKIRSTADVKNMSAEYDGKPINIKLKRDGEICNVTIKPYRNSGGGYELGVWLRDSISGLGTITFYDPDTGFFGALGHGVSDDCSGGLIEFKSGSVVNTEVTEVVEGKPGFPGQLRGCPNFSKQSGTISKNTDNGIFGVLSECNVDRAAMPVMPNEKIQVGKAELLCDVGYGTQKYEIEISRIYLGNGFNEKNMLITVTDERLLEITGGIVQGMSGSPIIQNGCLVGAVTHVLVNNPTKGYGITIENMLNAAE